MNNCNSNTQVINSITGKAGLKYVLESVYGFCNNGLNKYSIVDEYYSLLQKLVTDEYLGEDDLLILENILKDEKLLVEGEKFIENNRLTQKLKKNNISIGNIISVLTAKLIIYKVSAILGRDNVFLKNELNFNGKNDVFGKEIYEDKNKYAYKLGDSCFLLDKTTNNNIEIFFQGEGKSINETIIGIIETHGEEELPEEEIINNKKTIIYKKGSKFFLFDKKRNTKLEIFV